MVLQLQKSVVMGIWPFEVLKGQNAINWVISFHVKTTIPCLFFLLHERELRHVYGQVKLEEIARSLLVQETS